MEEEEKQRAEGIRQRGGFGGIRHGGGGEVADLGDPARRGPVVEEGEERTEIRILGEKKVLIEVFP